MKRSAGRNEKLCSLGLRRWAHVLRIVLAVVLVLVIGVLARVCDCDYDDEDEDD
jgi:hypothetical protein